MVDDIAGVDDQATTYSSSEPYVETGDVATPLVHLGAGYSADTSLPQDRPPLVPLAGWNFSFSVPEYRLLQGEEFTVSFSGTNEHLPGQYESNPVEVSGKVKFGLGRFSEWVRIPPRVDSYQGDGGYGEEIGIFVPPALANKCDTIYLEIERNGTGDAKFLETGSKSLTLEKGRFSNGYEPTPLKGADSTAGQSSEPGDVTINAYCTSNSKKISCKDFTVCAHPEDFYIEPADDGRCLEDASIGEISLRVKWHWQSDSGKGNEQDLDRIFIEEIYPKRASPGIRMTFDRIDSGEKGWTYDWRIISGNSYENIYQAFSLYPPHRAIAVGGHFFDCTRCRIGDSRLSSSLIEYSFNMIQEKIYKYSEHDNGHCANRCKAEKDWNFTQEVSCP